MTDELRAKLQKVPVAGLSGHLRKRGLDNVTIDGVREHRPGSKIFGTARTLRSVGNDLMPIRLSPTLRDDVSDAHRTLARTILVPMVSTSGDVRRRPRSDLSEVPLVSPGAHTDNQLCAQRQVLARFEAQAVTWNVVES